MSNTVVSLAVAATDAAHDMPPRETEYTAAVLDVFATNILLTRVVVADGTVYTVDALVVAGPLAKTLNVLGILSPYSPKRARPSMSDILAASITDAELS